VVRETFARWQPSVGHCFAPVPSPEVRGSAGTNVISWWPRIPAGSKEREFSRLQADA
jgi:hypothetical protein